MANSIEKGSHDSLKELDAKEEAIDRALTQKIDWNLLPILTLLYLLSFLDRSNVGNAKVDGLATQINLQGAEYNTGLALYFVGYVLFEIPANIVLKRTSPRTWLPTITLIWGVISVCQGLVTDKAGFYAVRFFLGVTEAGLFPGVIYVFSMYYTRTQRSIRVSFFFSGSALAGAFGGVLAYLLGLINGGGKPGWAWIFIVEGLITIVVSFIAYFLVPSWPQHASFLTESERERLINRLRRDTDAADLEPFNWKGVGQALTDPLSITTPTAGSQYFGTFVIVGGVYTANAMLLSWPGENVSAQTKRAVVLALQITLGDVGAITGTTIFFLQNRLLLKKQ
ncbi:hypothetical protein Clacol_008347 [Clathrus columnatus]|uniref:Major facilitator superfamily (MFS) profile domain-containing protein n=1 Tax=Clathrus columnatus TaxID=1419009 RepID=A0AAV5AML6_9AGAM|nr:hypothetical protein Clacol_008347 [Clathrus columnatus]